MGSPELSGETEGEDARFSAREIIHLGELNLIGGQTRACAMAERVSLGALGLERFYSFLSVLGTKHVLTACSRLFA